MIQNIGYSDDGSVFIRLVMDISGQQMTGTMILKPDFARNVAQSLIDAAKLADEKVMVLQ